MAETQALGPPSAVSQGVYCHEAGWEAGTRLDPEHSNVEYSITSSSLTLCHSGCLWPPFSFRLLDKVPVELDISCDILIYRFLKLQKISVSQII